MTIDDIFGGIVKDLGPYALAAVIMWLVIKYLMDALKEERAYTRDLVKGVMDANQRQTQVLAELTASIKGLD